MKPTGRIMGAAILAGVSLTAVSLMAEPISEKDVNKQAKGLFKDALAQFKADAAAVHQEMESEIASLRSLFQANAITAEEFAAGRNLANLRRQAVLRRLARSNQRDLLLGENGLSDLFNANQDGMSATTNFNFGQGDMAKYYSGLHKELQKNLSATEKSAAKPDPIQKDDNQIQAAQIWDPMPMEMPALPTGTVPGGMPYSFTHMTPDSAMCFVDEYGEAGLVVSGAWDPLAGPAIVTLTNGWGDVYTATANPMDGVDSTWLAEFPHGNSLFYGHYQMVTQQGAYSETRGFAVPPFPIDCPDQKKMDAAAKKLLGSHAKSVDGIYRPLVVDAGKDFDAHANSLLGDYLGDARPISETVESAAWHHAHFQDQLFNDLGHGAAASLEYGASHDPGLVYVPDSKDFDPDGKGFLGKWNDKNLGNIQKTWAKAEKFDQKLAKAVRKKKQRIAIRRKPPIVRKRAHIREQDQPGDFTAPVPLEIWGAIAYGDVSGPGRIHCWGRGPTAIGPIVIRPHVATDNAFQPEIGTFTATTPMEGLANTWECIVPGIAPGYFALTAEQLQPDNGLVRTEPFLINLPGPDGGDR
jgi:hypothetical protein